MCWPQTGIEVVQSGIKGKYEIKVNELNEESRAVACLGRRIRWSEEWIDIEADPKHVGILLGMGS